MIYLLVILLPPLILIVVVLMYVTAGSYTPGQSGDLVGMFAALVIVALFYVLGASAGK